MRRSSSALLSFVVLPAGVLAAPVLPSGVAAPVPVPPAVHEIVLPGVLTPAALGGQERTVALLHPTPTDAFSTLGVTWAPDPAVGEVEVEIRTRVRGRWTGWVELAQEEAATPGEGPDAADGLRSGTEPAWVGPSDAVEARVVAVSGPTPTDLRLVLVDPGRSAADSGGAPVLGHGVATAATRRPAVRTRAEWGADERLRTEAPAYSKTVQAVAVHHTAGANDYAAADVPAVLRGIYAFHVQGRGWSDIGYNLLVDRFGTAWEGRWGGLDRPVIGAHAGGFNTDTAGISMIGTFETAPPAATLETVAQLAAWKLSTYHRDPTGSVTLTSRGSTRYPEGQPVSLPRLFGHRDVSQTSCPGTGGVQALPALRTRVAALIADGPPSSTPHPLGAYDGAVPERPGIRLTGWAVDPDASVSTQLATTLNGRPGPVLSARGPRPDVVAAYPPYGEASGLDAVVPVDPGTHEVCLVAVNQGAGADRPLGCRTVVVPVPPAVPPTRAAERSCPPGRVPAAGFTDTRSGTHERAIDCVRWWGLAQGLTSTTYGPGRPVSRAQMATFLARLVHESGGTLPADPPDAFDDDGGTGVHQRAINQLAAVGISRGKGGRTYDPSGLVTRGQLATFLTAAVEHRTGQALAPGQDYFYDDDGSVHEPAIGKVTRAGVAGGVAAGRYDPVGSANRGQMASFLARVLDLLVEGGHTAPRG